MVVVLPFLLDWHSMNFLFCSRLERLLVSMAPILPFVDMSLVFVLVLVRLDSRSTNSLFCSRLERWPVAMAPFLEWFHRPLGALEGCSLGIPCSPVVSREPMSPSLELADMFAP